MLVFVYDLLHELWLCHEVVCLSDTAVFSGHMNAFKLGQKATLTAKYFVVEIVIVSIPRTK